MMHEHSFDLELRADLEQRARYFAAKFGQMPLMNFRVTATISGLGLDEVHDVATGLKELLVDSMQWQEFEILVCDSDGTLEVEASIKEFDAKRASDCLCDDLWRLCGVLVSDLDAIDIVVTSVLGSKAEQ